MVGQPSLKRIVFNLNEKLNSFLEYLVNCSAKKKMEIIKNRDDENKKLLNVGNMESVDITITAIRRE